MVAVATLAGALPASTPAVTDGQPTVTVTVTTVPAAADCPYGDQPGTPIRRPHVAGIKPGHYPPDIACWQLPGGP